MKKLLLVFLLMFFIGAGYLLIAFNYSYSDGSRAGYIQKFAHKTGARPGTVVMANSPSFVLQTQPLWENF